MRSYSSCHLAVFGGNNDHHILWLQKGGLLLCQLRIPPCLLRLRHLLSAANNQKDSKQNGNGAREWQFATSVLHAFLFSVGTARILKPSKRRARAKVEAVMPIIGTTTVNSRSWWSGWGEQQQAAAAALSAERSGCSSRTRSNEYLRSPIRFWEGVLGLVFLSGNELIYL